MRRYLTNFNWFGQISAQLKWRWLVKLVTSAGFSLAVLVVMPLNGRSVELGIGEQNQLARLKALGHTGLPLLYIRLFKEEKVLEVWVSAKGGYKLFRSYPICRYSGALGPKIAEGDRQAPEGFYHVPAAEILWRSAKWPMALNIAFPNIFDASKARTGSNLLIHGGCSSRGCYALGDGPMRDLFFLVSLLKKRGQTYFPVHIFPFRLTQKNWHRHKGHKWAGFWRSLQGVFDHFSQHRSLPGVVVCKAGYEVPLRGRWLKADTIVLGSCLRPLPAGFVKQLDSVPQWAFETAARYRPSPPRRDEASPQLINVKCNLKRPSCRRWLALHRKMMKKGTLPKALLKPSSE